MFLEAESERLYVGARGAVFALNASDISASSALAVSVSAFHVDACPAPQLLIPQSSNGVICVQPGRNNRVLFLGRTLYSRGFLYFQSFKMCIFL